MKLIYCLYNKKDLVIIAPTLKDDLMEACVEFANMCEGFSQKFDVNSLTFNGGQLLFDPSLELLEKNIDNMECKSERLKKTGKLY